MKIIICGPRSVGRSTIRILLAKKLKYTYVSGDDLMDKEFQDLGGLDAATKAGFSFSIKKGVEVIKGVLKKENIILDLAGGALIPKPVDSYPKTLEAIKVGKLVGLLPDKNDNKSIEMLLNRE